MLTSADIASTPAAIAVPPGFGLAGSANLDSGNSESLNRGRTGSGLAAERYRARGRECLALSEERFLKMLFPWD